MNDADMLNRRNRELLILNTIAQALNREVDLENALQVTLSELVRLFDLQTGWVWLLDPESAEPYLAASLHLPPALVENPQVMAGTRYCFCLDAYQHGQIADATNIGIITCTRLKNLVGDTHGLQNHASIPLFAQQGEALGLLNVVGADWKELTYDELQMLNTVGELLSIAIERARLFKRSTRLGAVEERNRLAREIHDTVAQGLTAISLRLDTIDAVIEANGSIEQVASLVKDALDLTQANLEEVRRSVMDLRAAPLEGLSLAEALQNLMQEHSNNTNLKVECHTIENRPLPPDIEVGLFRIAQEALANVTQHAQAKSAVVKLTTTPDQVQLIVQDDGVGFNPSEVTGKRFGLVGMSERARLMQGTLEICSSAGEGTRLEINIPLGDAHA